MNITNCSRLILITQFLFLIFIVYSNSDELADNVESSDGHLVEKSNSQIKSVSNNSSTSHSVVHLFKRSYQKCVTRLIGKSYKRICNGPRYHRPTWQQKPTRRPFRPPILPKIQPNGEYCGMRSYQRLSSGRVVGGREAEEKEFPWQVGIQENNGDGDFLLRGGGVIVDKRWILTAAHVFLNNPKVEDYRGMIGAVNLKGHPKVIKFDKLIKHDKYANTPDSYKNDIALLHVTEDIPLYPAVDNLNNICLPEPEEEFRGSVTVCGWGKIHESRVEGTDKLMTVDLQVFGPEVCERNYKHYFTKRIMICAGYERGGKDSCSGDSGGPLIKKKRDERWYLAGIVSFGGYMKCARKGTGASYTKVSKYISWIMNNMKE